MSTFNNIAAAAVNGFLKFVEEESPAIVEEVSKLAKSWGERNGVPGIELRRVTKADPAKIDTDIDAQIEKKF
jgi:hypothetical protein